MAGIKDCKDYFSSSCPQMDCVNASLPETTTAEFGQRPRQERINKSTRRPTNNGRKHMKPYSFPDLHPIGPAAVMEWNAKAESSSDGRPLLNVQDADKYVMMKHYYTSYNENHRVTVSTTETPVHITDLRLVEQNIAYEHLLEDAPTEDIEEYYCLHEDRLRAIQDEISTSETDIPRSTEMSRKSGGREQEGSRNMMGEREREMRICGLHTKRDQKTRMLVSCERGVRRLLLKCQSLLDERNLYD